MESTSTPVINLDELQENDILCKKLLNQLLQNQSVASWAASAIEAEQQTRQRKTSAPRVLVGRREQTCAETDQSTAALMRNLVTEKPHFPSESGSDTSSDISMASTFDRRSSLSSDTGVLGIKGMNPDRYKTELCRQFQETGFCKYGSKCQFAHGTHEIRTVQRHQKYKTEMCRTYHTSGFCPYGTRCHFLHDEDESSGKKQPKPITRRNVTRHVSVPLRRDFNPTVGSVGDTPTSSLSSSPAPSLSFLDEDRNDSSVFLPAGAPPATAPAHIPSAPVFTFNEVLPVADLGPLAVTIPKNPNPVSSFEAGLQAAWPALSKENVNSCNDDFFFMPSTPPMCDSDSETPFGESASLDQSRGGRRLSIFSQLSKA